MFRSPLVICQIVSVCVQAPKQTHETGLAQTTSVLRLDGEPYCLQKIRAPSSEKPENRFLKSFDEIRVLSQGRSFTLLTYW